MEPIKIATAQFENRSNDKAYNLGVIRKLAQQAREQGAQVIAFHECSVTGYSFARHLNKEELTAIAELISEGESVQEFNCHCTRSRYYHTGRFGLKRQLTECCTKHMYA